MSQPNHHSRCRLGLISWTNRKYSNLNIWREGEVWEGGGERRDRDIVEEERKSEKESSLVWRKRSEKWENTPFQCGKFLLLLSRVHLFPASWEVFRRCLLYLSFHTLLSLVKYSLSIQMSRRRTMMEGEPLTVLHVFCIKSKMYPTAFFSYYRPRTPERWLGEIIYFQPTAAVSITFRGKKNFFPPPIDLWESVCVCVKARNVFFPPPHRQYN